MNRPNAFELVFSESDDDDRKLELENYDLDYSEIEDLIVEVDKDNNSSVEERAMTQILTEYGTIGLLMFYRAKRD